MHLARIKSPMGAERVEGSKPHTGLTFVGLIRSTSDEAPKEILGQLLVMCYKRRCGLIGEERCSRLGRGY